MQENKKKKSSGMWMFLLIVVLAIGYFVCDSYFKDDTKHNQQIVMSDIKVGTVYKYSAEEIQDFISKAEKQLEYDKTNYGVKPGYDIYAWKELGEDIGSLYAEDAESVVSYQNDNSYYTLMTFTDGKNVWQMTMQHGLTEKLPSQVKYKVNKLKAKDAFNNDLSLKIADAFYGYASVGNPFYIGYDDDTDSLKTMDKATDYLFAYVYCMENFQSELEEIDKEYKGSNDLYSIMKNIDYKSIDKIDTTFGGGALFSNIYRASNKTNSMNPMQDFLAGRYDWNYDNQSGISKVLNSLNNNPNKKNKTELFPEEYNYYADHDNYFFYYYPVRVEKMSDNTYLVDIETSDVITRYAAEMVYYQIATNFNRNIKSLQSNATTLAEYSQKMDIVIRINNTDMNQGMLLDSMMSSVLYPVLIKDPNNIYDVVSDNSLRILNDQNDEIPWYPNEEAQKLLKTYFTYAKEAYNNDSYFSIVETIEKAANENSMSVKDAKSVVYSYYLYCNYGQNRNIY